MSSSDSALVVRAIGAGVMSGIRSMSGPEMATIDAQRDGRELAGTPFELLKKPEAPVVVGLLSAGELVADKLPFVPNRTDPAPLFVRLLLGGSAGAVIFTGRGESAAVGAALGALGALVSSFVSFRVRRFLTKNLGLPNVAGGLVGDAVLIGIGAALLRVE